MAKPLRDIADERGWTLTEIARKAGVGISTVGNFLNGETRAGPGLLKKMAQVFEVKEQDIDRKQPPRERNIELKEEEESYKVTGGGEPAKRMDMATGERKRRELHFWLREVPKAGLIKKLVEVLEEVHESPEVRYQSARDLIEYMEWREKRQTRPGNGN